MSRYTAQEREQAVLRSKEIGVRKTCLELGMSVQTLWKWRKESREKEISENAETSHPIQSNTKKACVNSDTQAEQLSIHGIEEAIQRDLADARQLNCVTQETIDYLIEENRELRKRCERYLKALALVAE